MTNPRHFSTVGPLWLLAALALFGSVTILGANSPKHVDLGEGWNPRFPAGQHTAILTRKLRRIILPNVDLHDVPFSEAIGYFQRAFRDCDSEHLGMSFFVKAPRYPEPRVTLKLRKIHYSAALDKLATAVGMKWLIDPYAIAFIPLPESTEPLFVADRATPPEAVGFPADTKEWLKSRGVDFPPGASAKYLVDQHRLVVRQTQANIQKIGLLVTRRKNSSSPSSNP